MARFRERHPDAPEPAVRWLPFQLNPDLPPDGIPRAEYVARKFGARGRGNYERVANVGRTVGIDFAFDKIQVQPNTVNAHRLLIFAERTGKQDEVADQLFQAYFLEGANLTDNAALARAAERAGLDSKSVVAYLDSDEDKALVEQADAEARSAGIGGVPFFIFNRKVGVSGAQDADVLVEAMEQASQDAEK